MLEAKVLSEFGILAQRGAEHAGEALSKFVRREITVAVRRVELAPVETIPEQLGNGERLAVGLLSRVCGEIEGNAALLYDRADALRLVQLLGSRDETLAVEGFGALERSMLEETANIAITSFMNSLTAHLDRRCVPNAPVYLLDLAGAILSVILMENAALADHAFFLLTEFRCEGEDLSAVFAFLPSPASLDALREGLHGQ